MAFVGAWSKQRVAHRVRVPKMEVLPDETGSCRRMAQLDEMQTVNRGLMVATRTCSHVAFHMTWRTKDS